MYILDNIAYKYTVYTLGSIGRWSVYECNIMYNNAI